MAQASTDAGAPGTQSAYSWSGSLQATNIRQLYERCQKLRLTGVMRLKQGSDSLELTWIGGEPIENEGDQGTRSLPLWNNGEFRVEQRMPDWKGRLTPGTEVSGPLKAGQIQAIYKLCSDHLLSAEVELSRAGGESAQVRFSLGKAESATISGQTESALTALSKLGGWVEGSFRITLRPMFGDSAVAEAPVFSGKRDSDDQFDVTGSLDLARGNVAWPPKPKEGGGAPGGPVPMGAPLPGAKTTGATGASPMGAAPMTATAPASVPAGVAPGSVPINVPPRLAQTLITPQKAPGAAALAAVSNTAPTVPMSTVNKQQLSKAQAQAAAAQKPQRSLGIIIVAGVLSILALAGVVVAALLLLKK